jgi:membrane-bound lytic murein transglycosylase D
MGRQANLVAKEGLESGHKSYRLGPRYEKQLAKMVSQEFQALAGQKEDIPFELNQEVLININYFLNDARGFMTRSLNRGQKYIPIMKAILKQKGLPEDLVYLALIESGYRTEAVSHASAVGPWQFIASTGRRYGLTIDEWVDERMDPIMSTYAAADYLIALYEMFHSWPLAIAAYNSGEGKIMKGMLKPEVDNYWDMAKADGFLANETKRYVPSFLAVAIIAKDPLAYGLEVIRAEVDTWDEVVVPEPIDLTMVAQLASSSLERIKELNPQLKRMSTPPSERDFVLRVPRGSGDSFYQLYAQLPETQRSNRLVIHLAKRGDTVQSVAARYNLTPEVVTQYNNLSSPRLTAGQRLVLPATLAQAPGLTEPIAVASERVRSSRPADYPPRVAEVRFEGDQRPIVLSPEPSRSQGPGFATRRAADTPRTQTVVPVRARTSTRDNPLITTIRHRVRADETLGELARRYGTTAEKLRSENSLASNVIREGQVLVVSSNLAVTPDAAPKSKTTWVEEAVEVPVHHLVKAGETLGSIAARYNTSSERLRSLNSLANSNILAGQKLVVGSTPQEGASGLGFYVVRVGDTVSQIAERHNLSSAKLRELNNLSGDYLRPGQELKVASVQDRAPAAKTQKRVYEVKAGDTVSQIAARHNMSAKELRSLNKLKGDRLVQGQKLTILTAAPAKPTVTPAVHRTTGDGLVYEVAPGDTLSVIAAKHNLTTAELRELNDLESDQIRSGQKLLVALPEEPPTKAPPAQAPPRERGASPASRDYYEVVAGDSVSVIAERHNLTSAELRDLNNLPDNRLRIGQRLRVTPAAPAKERSEPTRPEPNRPVARTTTSAAPAVYEVAPGDSVSVIAEKHRLTSAELRELNNLKDDRIRVGQKLKVAATSGARAPAKETNPPVVARTSSAQSPRPDLYEVVPGDSVSVIAAKHNLTAVELRELNNLTDDKIRVGQKLKVAASAPSGSKAPTAQAPSSSGSNVYEVAPGDSVSVIAERHGMTSDELRKLNNLTDDKIRVGQKLKVAAKPESSPRTQAAASPKPSASPNPGDYYVAELGDSITSVAAFYKTTPAELRRLNQLSGDALSPGQKILVKSAGKPAASGDKSGQSYQVASGDTLVSIAKAHNLTVDQLRKLNNKTDNDIRPGQTLKVKP